MKYWITFVLLIFTSMSAQAAEFQWIDQNGTTHHLSEMKGKPVILHLWASWCPPCQSELPEFSAWFNTHQGITTIPVSLDDHISDVTAFLTAEKINIPALLSDSDQARQLGVRGLPTTLLIAADGSISQHHLGPQDWTDKSFTTALSR
ncbi:TlpA family protein disulfide reductase [Mariprofundus sp. EBB-1]|uniref:TlpA family protein disulfide reductase n=1 Tax=Mariprofundus sp. EBB-1 TaxID=2650971 RepID=UPI000EF23DC4|nr:TlpA disulfide reductase family protein [Mariprofundus sp. EBB-1]RLL50994.1 TlpA family protein disulfide reductase [Mariprofundus sp. EBB-1]